jgi:hypothetical protein
LVARTAVSIVPWPERLQAVDAGQPDIEEQGIELLPAEGLQPLLAGLGGRHKVALVRQDRL